MTGAMLSQERLKSLLNYDQETGIFTCLVSRGRNAKVGSIAGTVDPKGYVRIKIDGQQYKAHRLAWLYVYGDLPPDQMDHINRIKTDNRIGNLRLATQAENQQNRSMRSDNTSGHIGVSWYKSAEKWQAQIRINHKQINIGYFANLQDAIAARKAAEIKYFTFQHNQGNQP